MPSEYSPPASANSWMERENVSSSVQERPAATGSRAQRPGAKRTVLSAFLQRLARALGVPAEELAKKIPDDTIRRTKFPVVIEQLEDGKYKFKYVPEVVEDGRRGTVR